jgi:hypothetical protein
VPQRSVEFVVPTAAGSTMDLLARLIVDIWRKYDLLRARDEITESKEKNPAAGRNAGKESGVYA